MKNLSILGSTGSIGQSTLDVVSRMKDSVRVVALAAGRNLDLLDKQVRDFSPAVVAVADPGAARELSQRVNGVEILSGPEGVEKVASFGEADFVISAIAGSAGLGPTLSAVRAGKTVGLANKEALVMAGGIVMAEAKKKGVKLIPVDSEHSAVFQCLGGQQRSDVRRIVLTASGGPFRGVPKEGFDSISAKEALRHPNWNMGKKITIDSATLMNKGLEVIEASWLFDLGPGEIDVLIHPQSIVHSMVEFRDRGFLAQMSVPDMRGPIAYALSWPDRIDDPIPGLSLESVGTLTFEKPDLDRFPCLALAYDALRAGGNMPCVLNAANEVAVHAFLDGVIGFTDIPRIVSRVLDGCSHRRVDTLDEVMDADRRARESASAMVRESAA